MIASLPMYDWPETRDATDAWWSGLAFWLRRAGLSDVPDQLTRDVELAEVWNHPRLLLSQTCGLPLFRHYRDRLRAVATPCYAAQGCDGPTYSSAILVRDDDAITSLPDLRGCLAAYNSADSLSGHLALRLVLAGFGRLLAGSVETGSHAASMAAVAEGGADVCAIDCVTWAIATRHRAELTGNLRRIAWSPPMPALPYVTSAGRGETEVAALRAGLRAAMQDPTLAECRLGLLLAGFELAPGDAYAAIGPVDASTPELSFS